MNIENITLNHSITIDEYNDLRASVDFITIRENRARIALDHSLYTLIARENGRPVGMARVVGDGGYVYFICDVIVRPSHQSQGLGRYIIEHVLSLSLLAPALPAADPRRMARGARLFADDLHRRGHALPEGHVPHRRTARSDFEYV